MKRWLDYATQVSELEKMSRLAPARAVVRALPSLLPKSASSSCLVCGKRPSRACSACGAVSYCGPPHQQLDARWHDPVCDALRDALEDRREPEDREALVGDLLARVAQSRDLRALGGWDALLGNDPALTPSRRRHLTDLASRPMTLASMLVGLDLPSRAPRDGTLTVHVMAAAQRESELPIEVWGIVRRYVPQRLAIALVGPDLPRSFVVENEGVVVRARKSFYARSLWAELGTPDLVVGHHCGLTLHPTWKSTVVELCGSGVTFVTTTYRAFEAAVEARLLASAKATCVVPPVENRWASLLGRRSSTIANDVSFENAFVSAWS